MAVDAAHVVQIVLLKVFLPHRPERTAGVLLFEEATGNLYFRIREDWNRIADPLDAEVLSELSGDFHTRMRELGEGGGAEFLRQLEDQLSNVLRLTERQELAVTDIRSTLDLLFDEHCRD